MAEDLSNVSMQSPEQNLQAFTTAFTTASPLRTVAPESDDTFSAEQLKMWALEYDRDMAAQALRIVRANIDNLVLAYRRAHTDLHIDSAKINSGHWGHERLDLRTEEDIRKMDQATEKAQPLFDKRKVLKKQVHISVRSVFSFADELISSGNATKLYSRSRESFLVRINTVPKKEANLKKRSSRTRQVRKVHPNLEI